MAEAFVERTSKKLEKSFSKAKVVQTRAKKWDDVNKDALKTKENAFAVLRQVVDEDGAEGKAEDWETDEEMDAREANAPTVVQSTVTAPMLDDDDDEIL
jgi:hypothetical protein